MIRSESPSSIQKAQTFWAFVCAANYARRPRYADLALSPFAAPDLHPPHRNAQEFRVTRKSSEKRAGVQSNAQEFRVTRKSSGIAQGLEKTRKNIVISCMHKHCFPPCNKLLFVGHLIHLPYDFSYRQP